MQLSPDSFPPSSALRRIGLSNAPFWLPFRAVLASKMARFALQNGGVRNALCAKVLPDICFVNVFNTQMLNPSSLPFRQFALRLTAWTIAGRSAVADLPHPRWLFVAWMGGFAALPSIPPLLAFVP